MSEPSTKYSVKLLGAANSYRKRGFSVIPILALSKKPALASWKEYQNRIASDEEVSRWFGNGDRNIGIVTGLVSNLSVVDVDSPEALDMATRKGISSCPMVKTAKGYHFYCAFEPGTGNFQKRDDLPGIDLRSEGGFVVAPPSIHETGVEYRWEGWSRDLPKLPEWVLAKKWSGKKPLRELYAPLEVGSRNDTLTRLVGVWVKTLNLSDTVEMAIAWNIRNNPPLEMSEVERTVRSIYEREMRSRMRIVEPVTEAEYRTLADIKPDLDKLYLEGFVRGVSTGWSALDSLYTVRKGEWTLMTGIPSHGKSAFLDSMMVQIAENEDWKFGIFSAENLPHSRHAAGLIERYIGKSFDKNYARRMGPEEYQRGAEFLQEHFYFIAPDEHYQNLNRILEIANVLIQSKGMDAIVIDPWNELEHLRQDGMTETEYISQSLSKLRGYARFNQVHIFLVAHPTKLQKGNNGEYPVPTPYDVSGSAHWRNKADNCLAIWREMQDTSKPTKIHVQKIRFKEVGQPGICELFYDVASGRYS